MFSVKSLLFNGELSAADLTEMLNRFACFLLLYPRVLKLSFKRFQGIGPTLITNSLEI
jgi:hypothetical protein